jgi:hypothetical protein
MAGQSAVDNASHLIFVHDISNFGTDRSQPATMAQAENDAAQRQLEVVCGSGLLLDEKLPACEQAGVAVKRPKLQASGAKSAGRFTKPDFAYWPRTVSVAARLARSWVLPYPGSKSDVRAV